MPVQISFPQPPDEMEVDAPSDEQAPDASDEEFYVVENATLDIETYAYSYSGLARLYRLLYVADHCPALCLEALKYAFNYVQCTYNVALYQQIHAKLVDAFGASNQPDAVKFSGFSLDTKWIESQTKKAALKLEKLDSDLQNYKSNSIKESIRRGYNAIGDHYLDSGDLNNALKCYSRARDYCTNNKHIVDMCLNVIKVSIYLKNWTHVHSYVSKAESHGKDLEPHIVTKLHCAMGLAELANKKYKSAAKNFLLSSFDHCEFPDLMSPSNVATYGSLCALATFDRKEMLKNVISNSSFKQFLELEPQLRDIIFTFYDSKYAHCLKLLEEIKDNLYLDMYLAPHIKSLYAQIRNRALIQYFSPYLSADMHRMAEAFNTNVPTLEDEIMRLILDNQISARIDSHKKILYAKTTDQRSSTFEHFLSFAKEYQQKTIAMLLRSAMIRNNICIKSPQGDGAGEMTPGNTTPCN